MAGMKFMIYSARLKNVENKNTEMIETINLNYKIQYQN